MFLSQRVKRWTAIIVALSCLLLVAPMAFADSGAAEIENLRNRLTSLQDQVDDDTAEAEFEMTVQWLEEAQALHDQGARSGISQRIRRVDHAIDLLTALVDTRNMERSIEHQIQAYENTKKQVQNLKKDIESLEKQKKEREAELQRIQNSQ